jgi:flagellar protein FlaF
MYRFSYAEILDDDEPASRQRERQAMEQAIELLEAAESAGPKSRESVEALSFLRRLWTAFMEDLSDPDHELPKAWRANLFSIGLFVLNEVEQIRFGKSQNYRRLIDISKSVAGGLA